MDIVPLVSMNYTRLYDGKHSEALLLEDVPKRVPKDSLLYVLDLDGIERNNPNLELYQRLADHCILWIDNGPRRIDDVMDTIMAGATNLTLREDLWSNLDMPEVQELTDDEIYLERTRPFQEEMTLQHGYGEDIGIILFNEEQMYGSVLKERLANRKLYVYAHSLEKIQLWTEQGITGVVIDLKHHQGMM